MAKMPKVKAKSPESVRKQKVEKRMPRPQKKAGPKKSVIDRIKQYLRDVKQELKRTVWPTRQQVISSSVVVIAVLVIFSLIVGSLDFVLVKLIKLITLRF